ncbi:MAG TPA: hypothetical protein VNB90_09925 [Cytophagaceae bacterium]|jgi:hypothetical protein|nr:hypothetical protein [Cytophagaceae bacterium]
METLSLPKSILIKEIFRYEEDLYILNAETTSCAGWDFQSSAMFIRTDIKALSEILRLENPSQSASIEELLLNMLSYGEPPRIDIKSLTGDYLRLRKSEVVLSNPTNKPLSDNIHDLPQIVDVFPTFEIASLSDYLNLEQEFSKEILEKTFFDFQKTFFLIDRGYTVDAASAMTQTNNPISALIYQKIKDQLDPQEIIFTPEAQSEEDILEENYTIKEFLNLRNTELPF